MRRARYVAMPTTRRTDRTSKAISRLSRVEVPVLDAESLAVVTIAGAPVGVPVGVAVGLCEGDLVGALVGLGVGVAVGK